MSEALTHKGWYWFCPVYLSPDAEDMPVEPRHWSLEPIFTLAGWFDQARIFVSSLFLEDYEPTFMFKVTGKR